MSLKVFSIKVPDDFHPTLARASAITGLSQSKLAQIAVYALCDLIEKNKGLHVPFDPDTLHPFTKVNREAMEAGRRAKGRERSETGGNHK